MEEALGRAGVKPEQITTEIIEKSLDQINLVFKALLNRGIQLWKRQQMILPCYLNTMNVPLPVGINLVDKLVRRSLTRQVGTPFSSAGGVAANAFDGNLATSCDQTTINGNIGCTFADPVAITTVGVLFVNAMTLSFNVQYSLDGVTNWKNIGGWDGEVSDNAWVWIDLDVVPAAKGWRVLVGSDGRFDAREIFFGINPSEIPLDPPMNLDEYNSLPNKRSGGRVLQYYQQRNLDHVTLMVWPVPNQLAIFDTLVVWVREYLDTVNEPVQSLDIPQRWQEAVTAMLARRLCRSLPEADLKRYDMLLGEEQEFVTLAEGEESDYKSNSNLDLGISAYTA